MSELLQTTDRGLYCEPGGVNVSFYPAGHILGSAQVRLEYRGRVALVTGDYKLGDDPTCQSWEPVRCHLMVTESTVGLPVIFQAFDSLEHEGCDIRSQPFRERRRKLERLLETVDHPSLNATQISEGSSWHDWQTVRRHTQEAFGPVRSVKPDLVMEIAFEGVRRSPRHKSGIATRFPRIARWRHDKKATDANQLSELLEMLPDE